MKRTTFAVLLFLVSLPLWSQTVPQSQFNQDFITSNQCVKVPATGLSVGSYTVTGSWSGTLTAYGVLGQGSPVSLQSETANGTYTTSISGYTLFEVCGNTVASGSAFVQVSAATSSGGGVNAPGSACGDASHALGWTGSAFNCQSITGSAAAGGSPGQLQWNNAGALAGILDFTTNGTTTLTGGAASILDLSAMVVANLKLPAAFVQTNGINLASVAGFNFINSTTNASGLTFTFSNPGTNQIQGEIGGSPTTLNGASVPTSTLSVKTNSSGQIVDSSSRFAPTYYTNDQTGSDLCAKITAALLQCPSGATNSCKVVVQPTTPGTADHCAAGTSDFWSGVTPRLVEWDVQAQVFLKATANFPFTPHFVHGSGSNQSMQGAGFYMDTPFTSTTLFANNSTTLLSGEGPAAFAGQAMNVLISDGGRTSGTAINQWQQNGSGAHWQDIRLDCNNQPNCIPYYTANMEEKSYYVNVALWNQATSCTTAGCNYSIGMFFDHYAAQTGNFGPSHFSLKNVGVNAYENTTGTSPNQTIAGIVYEGANCPPATCTVTGGNAAPTGGNIEINGGTIRGAGSTQLLTYGVWIDGTTNNLFINTHCEWISSSNNCYILGAGGNATTSTTLVGISDVNNAVNAVHFHTGNNNVVLQSDNGVTDDVNSCNPSGNIDSYWQAGGGSGYWSNTYHYACATGIPVTLMAATGTPSSSTFLRGDGTWSTPSGSGTVTASPQYQIPDYSAVGTASTLTGVAWLTGYDGVNQFLQEVTSSGSATAPAPGVSGVPVNAQTAAGYTPVIADRAKLITLSNASAQNLVLTNPTTAGFDRNFVFAAKNIGAGAWMETASGFTINGATTLLLPPNWTVFNWSDNTNYVASRFPDFTAFANTTSSQAEGFNSTTGTFSAVNVVNSVNGSSGALTGFTTNIANGTAAMGTGAISSGTCATVVTVSATGVATTDVITATPNADPTAVTGYAPSASGSLYIQAYPTANNVNFKVCNNTSGSITPSALTLNWKVVR